MPFEATCMHLEIVTLSEVSQTEKENIVWHPLYLESKKKWYKWTYYKTERLTDLENKFTVTCTHYYI